MRRHIQGKRFGNKMFISELFTVVGFSHTAGFKNRRGIFVPSVHAIWLAWITGLMYRCWLNSWRLFVARSLRIFLTLGHFSSRLSEVASLLPSHTVPAIGLNHVCFIYIYFLHVHCDSFKLSFEGYIIYKSFKFNFIHIIYSSFFFLFKFTFLPPWTLHCLKKLTYLEYWKQCLL